MHTYQLKLCVNAQFYAYVQGVSKQMQPINMIMIYYNHYF